MDKAHQQHPITPPPELVRQWKNALECPDMPSQKATYLAIQAARWGADQELEACCEWLTANGNPRWEVALQAGRRPKPPTLAEEALAELKEIMDELHEATGSGFTASAIRAALERLQELENNG